MGATLSELDWQRARNCLAACCHRRNALARGVGEWRVREDREGFVISEHDVARRRQQPVLKLRFEHGRWLLSVPVAGGWSPYPPCPEAAAIETVVGELEQAPLHVHWE